MKKELIAILGELGPPQLACISSWKRAGFQVAFVHLSHGMATSALAPTVDHYIHLPADIWTDNERIAQLEEFLLNRPVRALVTVSDQGMREISELCKRNDFRWEAWVCPNSALDLLQSKENQRQMAIQSGFSVLPTYRIVREAHDLPDPNSYPLVARPDRPNSLSKPFKARLLNKAEELLELKQCLSLEPGACLVLQPYIGNHGLVVHGYRSSDGTRCDFFAFDVFDRMDCLTLTLTPTEISNELWDACRKFTNLSGVCGAFHFEFLRSSRDHKLYFLELNARLGGTTGKALAAGFDEPMALIYAFGGVQTLSIPPSREMKKSSSKLALIKRILRLCRGESFGPFDSPKNAKAFVWLCLKSLRYADEILSLRPVSLIFAYFSASIGSKFKRLK